MTSLMLLSNSIEMRECRPLPGGGGHCLDIGESLGIWKGWRLHSTACTSSHVLHTCMVPGTQRTHCPNWVPLWPVLNLKPFSGDIIAQDLFVSMMTHKLGLGYKVLAWQFDSMYCHVIFFQTHQYFSTASFSSVSLPSCIRLTRKLPKKCWIISLLRTLSSPEGVR